MNHTLLWQVRQVRQVGASSLQMLVRHDFMYAIELVVCLQEPCVTMYAPNGSVHSYHSKRKGSLHDSQHHSPGGGADRSSSSSSSSKRQKVSVTSRSPSSTSNSSTISELDVPNSRRPTKGDYNHNFGRVAPASVAMTNVNPNEFPVEPFRVPFLLAEDGTSVCDICGHEFEHLSETKLHIRFHRRSMGACLLHSGLRDQSSA